MVAIFMIVVSGLSCGSSFVFAMISLCSFKIFYWLAKDVGMSVSEVMRASFMEYVLSISGV